MSADDKAAINLIAAGILAGNEDPMPRFRVRRARDNCTRRVGAC